jgi:vancomycin resistance protein YoaR
MLVAVMALGAVATALVAMPRDGVMGAYTTSVAQRTGSQRHNARLALDRLVGAVIGPGEVFSFNRRVGTFSEDRGFIKAPVSYNGQLIDDWGGGVCQTSTTLYNAALLAGMEIVERNRHEFAPSYVPPGRDAAVAFSSVDLRFRNPNPFPVRIAGRIEGARLIVELVGARPPSPRPEVLSDVQGVETPETYTLGEGPRHWLRNSGKAGCEVSVYRLTAGRRELISHDAYPAMNRVVELRRAR